MVSWEYKHEWCLSKQTLAGSCVLFSKRILFNVSCLDRNDYLLVFLCFVSEHSAFKLNQNYFCHEENVDEKNSRYMISKHNSVCGWKPNAMERAAELLFKKKN